MGRNYERGEKIMFFAFFRVFHIKTQLNDYIFLYIIDTNRYKLGVWGVENL